MFLFSLTAHFFVTSELSQENEKELKLFAQSNTFTHTQTDTRMPLNNLPTSNGDLDTAPYKWI